MNEGGKEKKRVDYESRRKRKKGVGYESRRKRKKKGRL